jgi:hypothetical protein
MAMARSGVGEHLAGKVVQGGKKVTVPCR